MQKPTNKFNLYMMCTNIQYTTLAPGKGLVNSSDSESLLLAIKQTIIVFYFLQVNGNHNATAI